jgi:hypothetical protein
LATFASQSVHAGSDQRTEVTTSSTTAVIRADPSTRRTGRCAARSSASVGQRRRARRCSLTHHSAGNASVASVRMGKARIIVDRARRTPARAHRSRFKAHAPSPMHMSQSWRSVAPPQFVPYMMKSLAPNTTITTAMLRYPKQRQMAPNVTRNKSGSSSAVTRKPPVLASNVLNRKWAMPIQTGVALPPKSPM